MITEIFNWFMYDSTNKVVTGKIKDEDKCITSAEFVGLKFVQLFMGAVFRITGL